MEAKNIDSSHISKNTCKAELNDFNIFLDSTDSGLSIQAENNLDSRLYRRKILIDAVSSISNGLFQTTQTMFQGFADAIHNKEASARFSINEEAKIFYEAELPLGSQKISFKFEFALEEEELDEKVMMKKQIEKLNREVMQLKKTIQSLEQRLSNENECSLTFDPDAPNKAYFNISNSGKTLTCKSTGQWRGIFASQPLPKQKKSTFSVRIDNTDANRHIMIGICASMAKNNQYFYPCIGSVAYYSYKEGDIRISHKDSPLTLCGGSIGTVIKFVTDLTINKVEIYYDDSLVCATSLDASVVQANDYYPFVDLCTTYDRVSFLSFKVE